jgi:uncharacterized protein (TIGR03437 family)
MNRLPVFSVVLLTVSLSLPGHIQAQSLFGRNLIVNGDAESGPSDPDGHTPVSSFPGWTASGTPDVNQYASGYDISLGDVIPALSVGNNYFSGGRAQANASLSQTIDLSSGSSTIDQGTVTFALSAYLGGFQGETETAQLTVTFVDGSGNQLASPMLGPVTDVDRGETTGIWFRRALGPVPAGARSVQVTLLFTWTSDATNDGAADNLSLVLNTPVSPQSLLGTNLIVNGDAETPAFPPMTSVTGQPIDIPGWSQEGLFTIDSYTDTGGDLTTTTPGPPNPGNFFFYGGESNAVSSANQSIDVSSAASLIDAGTVQYALSAWLGGYSSQNDNATLTVNFEDWNANSLGTVTLGPYLASDRNNNSELLQAAQNGSVPAGTRQINVLLTMTRTDGSDNDGLADSLSLILSGPGGGATPSIGGGGVVSAAAFGGFNVIAPGSWIEIYGTNLASDTRGWTGTDFTGSTAPTSLDQVMVTIGGQSAFIDYISPGQVNAQVPSSVGVGAQSLVLSNANGSSASYSIVVNATEPGLLAPGSFNIGGTAYVVAILPDGTYVLPTGAIAGINSRPVNPGETVTMYGVGFGPVTPNIPAGQIVGQANQLALPMTLSIGGAPATLSYDGLAPSFVGLYQFNVVIPNIGANNAAPVTFSLGGTPGQQTLYLAVQ